MKRKNLEKLLTRLTIQDLKDLGVIKKRRKRRKRKLNQQINVKSDSSHMAGFSQPIQTLDTEAQHLRNTQIRNEIENGKNTHQRLNDIDTDNKDFQNKAIMATQHLYNLIQTRYDKEPVVEESNETFSNINQNLDRNNYYSVDDGTDVATNQGSDSFKQEGLGYHEQTVNDTIDTSINEPIDERQISHESPQIRQPVLKRHIAVDTLRQRAISAGIPEDKLNSNTKAGLQEKINSTVNLKQLKKEYKDLGGTDVGIKKSTDGIYVKEELQKLKLQRREAFASFISK